VVKFRSRTQKSREKGRTRRKNFSAIAGKGQGGVNVLDGKGGMGSQGGTGINPMAPLQKSGDARRRRKQVQLEKYGSWTFAAGKNRNLKHLRIGGCR